MAYTYALRGPYVGVYAGGTVSYGPYGAAFNVGAALTAGGGTITTSDASLIAVLDDYPPLFRSGTSGTPVPEVTHRYESVSAGNGLVASEIAIEVRRNNEDYPRWEVLADGSMLGGTGSAPPTTISGSTSGAAGGVLSGTYPNPGFAVDMATQAELDAAIAGVSGSSSQVFAVVPASGNATTDTTNINAAITAATAAKGTVMLSPSTVDYQSTGGHTYGIAVQWDFNGQIVKHTSNNTFLKITHGGAPDFKPRRSAVGNGWLKGNNGAAAIGVECADSWGTYLHRLRIGSAESSSDAYSGTAGIGLRIHNEVSWCEGLRCEDVFLIQNKIGLQFKRTSGSGGTDSLAYTDFKNLAIAVGTSQTGIDMGVAGDTMVLYNSHLDVRCWLQGDTAVGVDVGANFRVPASTWANIRGESFGGTGRIFVKNRGGRLIPTGRVSMWRDGSTVDDVSSGKTLLEHSSTSRSYADTAVRAALQGGSTASDVPDITHAGLGFISQSNEEHIAVWGYGGGGQGKAIFSVAARPIATDQGATTNVSTNRKFRVDADGRASIQKTIQNVPLASLATDETLTLEAADAGVGIWADGVGTFGAWMALCEVVSSALVNKWAIGRHTNSTGTFPNRLDFTFGTNALWSSNTVLAYLNSVGLFGATGFAVVEGGAAARMGLSTLVTGAVTVSTTAVTTNSRIFLSVQTAGGTQGFLRISARSAGTSFTITSTSATETSTVAWQMVEPA